MSVVDRRPPAAQPTVRQSQRSAGSGDDGWIRNSKLAVACFTIFLVFWGAQALTGWKANNADLAEHQESELGLGEYLRTAHFAEATFENWESEFLQMGAFVLLTVFLVQKGSPESKKPTDDPHDEDPHRHRNDPDAPWPVRRGGVWLSVYENSLLIAFGLLFLGAFIGHALGGAAEFNSEQASHGSPPIGVLQFVRTSQFWFESFQNWQSEFLAVGSIVVLSIFLRQRGSSESKPVHAPHSETGD